MPSLNLRQNIRNFAGIRAATDVDDFIIRQAAPGFIDLAGIKSPGLSAAPAIAKMAVKLLSETGFNLDEKTFYKDTRKRLRFAELSPHEKAEFVAKKTAECNGYSEKYVAQGL